MSGGCPFARKVALRQKAQAGVNTHTKRAARTPNKVN